VTTKVITAFVLQYALQYTYVLKRKYVGICMFSHEAYRSYTYTFLGRHQCRINHMAEAAYATGPALLGSRAFGGPALLSSIFFLKFCFLFQRGDQTVRQSGPPKSLELVPQKTRGPKKSTPNVFFLFPVLVFQHGAQRAQGPQKTL
jgi:hypothetical protein